MERKKVLQVAVVGGSDEDLETLSIAREVGSVIADLGAVVICGGSWWGYGGCGTWRETP